MSLPTAQTLEDRPVGSSISAVRRAAEQRHAAAGQCRAAAERRLRETEAAFEADLQLAEAALARAEAALVELEKSEQREREAEAQRLAREKAEAEAKAKAQAEAEAEETAQVKAQGAGKIDKGKRRGGRVMVEEEEEEEDRDGLQPKKAQRLGACDRCRQRGIERLCKWPNGKGRRKVCMPCASTHKTCTQNGQSTASASRKRRRVMPEDSEPAPELGPEEDNNEVLYQPITQELLQQMVEEVKTQTALEVEMAGKLHQVCAEVRKWRRMHITNNQ